MIGVTFNIKFDDTYTARHQALTQVLKKYNPVETRTTSCVFLETAAKPDEVHTSLYLALDFKKDKAIVFETYSHTLKYLGLK